MTNNVLEKAGAIAAEKLKSIQAPVLEKAEAEAKVAAEAKVKTDAEKSKDEGIKLAEAQARAKEDERILEADDKTLSGPEVAKKAELKEAKRKQDELPENKIKRIQEESQKRIDQIKSELLAKENQSSERLKKLEAELAELKRPKIEETAKEQSKRSEEERIAKYTEEDKSKPRKDRREISKDELEAWYLEDPLEVTAWIQRRENKRAEDRKAAEVDTTKKTAKELADELIAKQKVSKEKLFAKFPGVNPSTERLAELKGKTQKEIVDILCDENEEFRLCTEIVAEDPKKYLQSADGPELVMAEIEKRLSDKSAKRGGGTGKIILTEDELEAKIQAEADRRALLNGEGASSTKGRKVETKPGQKSEQLQKLEKIAKRANIPMDELNKTIERRKHIPGAGTFEDPQNE